MFESSWNLGRDPVRRPRILFLADRNILADQAYNAFSAFAPDALCRISPDEIRKQGKIPKNASVFFTIFQTFMTGWMPRANRSSPSKAIRQTPSTSSSSMNAIAAALATKVAGAAFWNTSRPPCSWA